MTVRRFTRADGRLKPGFMDHNNTCRNGSCSQQLPTTVQLCLAWILMQSWRSDCRNSVALMRPAPPTGHTGPDLQLLTANSSVCVNWERQPSQSGTG